MNTSKHTRNLLTVAAVLVLVLVLFLVLVVVLVLDLLAGHSDSVAEKSNLNLLSVVAQPHYYN